MEKAVQRFFAFLLVVSLVTAAAGTGVLVSLAAAGQLILGEYTAEFTGESLKYNGSVTFDGAPLATPTDLELMYKGANDAQYGAGLPVNAGTYSVFASYTDATGGPHQAQTTMTVTRKLATSTDATRTVLTGIHTLLSHIALPTGWSWENGSMPLSGKPATANAFSAATPNFYSEMGLVYASFPLKSPYKDGEMLNFPKRSAAYDLSSLISPVNAAGVTYAVKWKTDNSAVASVSGQNLTAADVGLTKLTGTVTVTAVNGESVNIPAASYSFLVFVSGSGSAQNTGSELSSIIQSGTGVYEISPGDSQRIYAAAYTAQRLPYQQQYRLKSAALSRLSSLLSGAVGGNVTVSADVDRDSSIRSKDRIYLYDADWLLPAAGVTGAAGGPSSIVLELYQEVPSSRYDLSFSTALRHNASGRMRYADPLTSIYLEIEMPDNYDYDHDDVLTHILPDGSSETISFDYDRASNTIAFRTDELGTYNMRFGSSASAGDASSGSSSGAAPVVVIDPSSPQPAEENYPTGGQNPAPTAPVVPMPESAPPSAPAAEAPAVSEPAQVTPSAPISSETVPPEQENTSSGLVVITPEDVRSSTWENRNLILVAVVAAFVSAAVSASILCIGSARMRKRSATFAML